MYEACPYGERRADIRESIIAVNTITATSTKQFESNDAQQLYEKIRDYLKCYADPDSESDEIDHAALKKVKDAKCQA
jgi:hypothetical protein